MSTGKQNERHHLYEHTHVLPERASANAHRRQAELAVDEDPSGQRIHADADDRRHQHRERAIDGQHELRKRDLHQFQRCAGDHDAKISRLDIDEHFGMAEHPEDGPGHRQQCQQQRGVEKRKPDPLPEILPASAPIPATKTLADEGVDDHQGAEADTDEGEREHAAVGSGRGLKPGDFVRAEMREHPGIDELHQRVRSHLRDGRAGEEKHLNQRSSAAG